MWRTIKSDTVIEDYHVTVKKNAVQLPDGALINDFWLKFKEGKGSI